ncbi:hypothetical protein OKW21_004507 [Catalinimonas alkaloidigena]|uniref:hypothetical protein n=1 Tax=Catalinimonas alkaloidigena TaxID=1075417 RepID=UPI002404ADE2|nr:hypothetical protein [Catalinimonas alkaloidigena]MDF9799244.1 hypothetical protein [Catalinimonas alkaloidigena]
MRNKRYNQTSAARQLAGSLAVILMRKIYLIVVFLLACDASSNQAKEKGEIQKSLPINVEKILNEMDKNTFLTSFSEEYNISHPFLHEYGVDSESKGILVSTEFDPMVFAWSKWDSDSLYEIQVLSEKVELKSNIHVGMSVEEFINHYPDSKLYLNALDENSEYFIIKDNFEYIVEFLTNPQSRIGKYSNDQYETEILINTGKKADKISIRKITNG